MGPAVAGSTRYRAKRFDVAVTEVDEAAAAASQVVLADPLAFQGSDDMVRFNLLTEASIVHTLRVRYEREAIYTAVGPILISVNPLRQLEGLFGPFGPSGPEH